MHSLHVRTESSEPRTDPLKGWGLQRCSAALPVLTQTLKRSRKHQQTDTRPRHHGSGCISIGDPSSPGAGNRALNVKACGVGPWRSSRHKRDSPSSTLGRWPAATHQSAWKAPSNFSKYSRRLAISGVCALRYTKSKSASASDQTDMLISSNGSDVGWISVAFPASVCILQINPGVASANALIRSNASKKRLNACIAFSAPPCGRC